MLDSFSLALALALSAAILPTNFAEPEKPEAKIELRVAKDAAITYRGEKVALAELGAKLKDVENKAQTTVVIKAHADARTGDVMEIIRRLQEVGFEKFTLRAIVDCQ